VRRRWERPELLLFLFDFLLLNLGLVRRILRPPGVVEY
jgi:hypothetical protein